MKKLPPKLSEEIFLNLDYIICRFMKSKVAYKINQNQKDVWFTVKKVQEQRLHPQYHFHLRFNARDKWNDKDDNLDIDFYIDEESAKKLKELIGGKDVKT